MAETELKRTVSPAGAIAITVGSVIGTSIFVLINSTAAVTGPARRPAVLFALIVASLNEITVSQLNSSTPRSGGGYILTSRILEPLWRIERNGVDFEGIFMKIPGYEERQ
jgi:amino acid transporter